MDNTVSIKLQSIEGKNPPIWAIGKQNIRFWYYENEHGEQWVAKLDKETLKVSGLDIGWKEIELTLEQVEAERERITERLLLLSISKIPNVGETFARSYMETATTRQTSVQKLPLSEWILNNGEMLWIASVLTAAIPYMKWEKEKN
ncbi:hypothetical protein E8L90_03305 [Brevibacillus antibioticus]|uniref:Uncharacterized protein n=1 Tax=Brevibacillus antibioticus TaxID=2570228 RepID=A0A4U2Y2D8_9BACL|nr:hypothetical protein [Brevibacillus antibioticus]TKI54547.1 hypothetical protein E8L90_03305 [Brevibacillus antibioticus]